MSNMEIFLLDKLNNAKSEFNIIRPKSYQDLLKELKTKYYKYFRIF